ncbi:NADPH-dependent FMN reductase [Oceanobacillus jeddahense]|uniref:NADPH-dependent FMN reductase n=1 Tax=Oceanobacillus jeddahense TaxID=1462527 RepID=UPI00362692D9
MNNIAIIIGSTRPGRKGKTIAHWVHEIARQRKDVTFELVDIADYHLPLLDEPNAPALNQYTKAHTKAWSKRINEFDGYIFVTPEYNKATSGALKNAIDYLFNEWNNKACGFVGYGMAGGTSAVENLRQIMGELMVADVRAQVRVSIFTDFEQDGTFKPAAFQEGSVNAMLDQVISWSSALRVLRDK